MTNTILAYDTETNGLKPERSHAISLALVLGQSQLGQELQNVEEFYTLLDWRPFEDGFEIPLETTEVHGINMRDLDGQPNAIQAYARAYDFLMDYKEKYGRINILNGFNVTFDLHMVNSDLRYLLDYAKERGEDYHPELMSKVQSLLDLFYDEELSVIDSMFLDILFFKTIKGMKVRHNLTEAAARMNIVNYDAHNSLVDTRITLELLKEQEEKLWNEKQIGLVEFEPTILEMYEERESRFKKKVRSYYGRDY